MIDRRLSHHIDWLLVGALLLICAIGVAMIYSVTGASSGGTAASLYRTQIYAIVLGMAALAVCLTIDYRTLADASPFILLAVIGLLVYVLLFGSVQGGARRWIIVGLGPLAVNVQPSEFAKVALALALARLFAERRRSGPSAPELAAAGVVTGVLFILVARQPDLGTAATLVPVVVAVAYTAGMRVRIFVILLLVALASAPIVWRYGLRDYQKARITTFVDPFRDPRGDGYQQIQARITAGSGGLWGKGFERGTQGRLRFLPVAHNDFIFSALAEEQGFFGVLIVLALYLFVIQRALEAARLAKDRLGTYLVVGVLSSFVVQVVYNIAMSAGFAPVKGLTLPLMSYGGSSLIATLAGFGLILNVRMRRFTN